MWVFVWQKQATTRTSHLAVKVLQCKASPLSQTWLLAPKKGVQWKRYKKGWEMAHFAWQTFFSSNNYILPLAPKTLQNKDLHLKKNDFRSSKTGFFDGVGGPKSCFFFGFHTEICSSSVSPARLLPQEADRWVPQGHRVRSLAAMARPIWERNTPKVEEWWTSHPSWKEGVLGFSWWKPGKSKVF